VILSCEGFGVTVVVGIQRPEGVISSDMDSPKPIVGLPERQSELIDTHRAVQDVRLSYVLAGGWAVSAFQTRFTIDIDTVIPDTALNDYDTLLRDFGYHKQFE
jgi:hypothetical protein